jgi:hypothetical protein
MWCKAMVTSLSYQQRAKLMSDAIGLMNAGKLDDANALLKQVKSIEDLDDTLGALTCKPK